MLKLMVSSTGSSGLTGFLNNATWFLNNAFAGSMLSFSVGGRQAFEIAIADVSQTQMQGKHEVMLELHLDDTAGATEVMEAMIRTTCVLSVFGQWGLGGVWL